MESAENKSHEKLPPYEKWIVDDELDEVEIERGVESRMNACMMDSMKTFIEKR